MEGGLIPAIVDMSHVKKTTIIKVIKLLKFILSIDDKEIVNSTIESVIEMLEEEIK